MEVYLFRHGIAEDARPGHADPARELTAEGRRKTAAVAKTLRDAGVSASLILTSPYVRAVQTARIAAEELGYKADLAETKALIPNGTPEGVWDELRQHRSETAVLLAGHEPLMGHLAAYLLNCPALKIDVRKAAMIRIDIDRFAGAPHGILRWVITPKLCR